jgi:hypothetical protein
MTVTYCECPMVQIEAKDVRVGDATGLGPGFLRHLVTEVTFGDNADKVGAWKVDADGNVPSFPTVHIQAGGMGNHTQPHFRQWVCAHRTDHGA